MVQWVQSGFRHCAPKMYVVLYSIHKIATTVRAAYSRTISMRIKPLQCQQLAVVQLVPYMARIGVRFSVFIAQPPLLTQSL